MKGIAKSGGKDVDKDNDKDKVNVNMFYERMVLEVEGREVEVQEDLLSTHSR